MVTKAKHFNVFLAVFEGGRGRVALCGRDLRAKITEPDTLTRNNFGHRQAMETRMGSCRRGRRTLPTIFGTITVYLWNFRTTQLGSPHCSKNHCKTYGSFVCGIRCIYACVS